MTPPRLAYPDEVAAVFVRREEAISRQLENSLFGRYSKDLAKSSIPSPLELKQLVETMLFASLATEEGHFTPVGIVFAEHLMALDTSKWTLVRFHSPLNFEAGSISKYASACGKTEALLAVVRSNQELKVVGIATPPRSEWFAFPGLVKVIALKPGDISIWRDTEEIVRYQRGQILEKKPSVHVTEKYRIGQLDAIQQAVLGNDVEQAHGSSIFFDLSRIFEGMVRLEHGGLLVVLGPDDEQDGFPEGSMRLAEPLKLGEALREAHKARIVQSANRINFDIIENSYESTTEQQERENERVKTTDEHVSWMVAQATRLTTVDGAVVLNHHLDILAFGVKVLSQSVEDIDVLSIDPEGRPGKAFPLKKRGTRHRAAAVFAKEHPKGLAIVVSQDGDAAIFVMHDSQLVHWPLGI